MKNMLTNEVNPAFIFNTAKELLAGGIAKVCSWPISAFDINGRTVKINDPKAVRFTPSGAVMKSIINHSGSEDNLPRKTNAYLEELAKMIPETHMHKYELPISFDLACMNKSDQEIFFAFECAIKKVKQIHD